MYIILYKIMCIYKHVYKYPIVVPVLCSIAMFLICFDPSCSGPPSV